MNRWKEVATLCCLAGLVCSFTTESNPLDKAKKVARLKKAGDDQLIAVDYSAFSSKEITLPLSLFTEEMQIVKLDDREEALVGNSALTISENYILVGNHQQNPCKLFDKQGKFLTAIGVIGQGPGEYQNIYDAAIDEKDGLIYLVGWNARNVLVYDLKGKFIEALPVPSMILKGVCWPDAVTRAVSVAALAAEQSPAVAYTLIRRADLPAWSNRGRWRFRYKTRITTKSNPVKIHPKRICLFSASSIVVPTRFIITMRPGELCVRVLPSISCRIPLSILTRNSRIILWETFQSKRRKVRMLRLLRIRVST